MRTNRKIIFLLFLSSTFLLAEKPSLGRRPVTAQDILDDPSAVLEIDEPDISQLPPLGDPEAIGGGPPPPSLGRALGKAPLQNGNKASAVFSGGQPVLLQNPTALPGGLISPTQPSNVSKAMGQQNGIANSTPAQGPIGVNNSPKVSGQLPQTAAPTQLGANSPGPVAAPSMAGATLPLVLSPQFFNQQSPRVPAQSAVAPAAAPAVESMDVLMLPGSSAGASTSNGPGSVQAGVSLLPVAAPATGFTERVPMLPSTAMPPLAGVPDVAVILVQNQFYPSRIKLKDGMQTRLIFTTTNKKPAALIVERLQIQRWIAKEAEPQERIGNDRQKWEATREVTSNRITEIVVEPKAGTYSFHDAITGATGELVVE